MTFCMTFSMTFLHLHHRRYLIQIFIVYQIFLTPSEMCVKILLHLL